jgi:hypothetical protein
MVAGYVDKIVLEPWSSADWARFPNAAKVRIVKKASTNDGHVLDVEPGDATPAQAPGWVKMRRQSGFANPTIYCNKSTWPTVIQAFLAQGVAMPLWWIAQYNGVKELPSLQGQTAIAKQYAGDVAPGYDLSYVADFWPGVDTDMALDNDDKNWIRAQLTSSPAGAAAEPGVNKMDGWWYAPRFQGNLNYAQVVTGMKDSIIGLQATLGSLVQTVIANEANDLTIPALVEQLVPALKPAIMEALGDVEGLNEAEVANAVAVRFANLLGAQQA